ncbi:uncharacterized protein NPIL_331731 [Nephila pilipes]|uniref:Uncharacterized protein n=1 Tax=Nephila pilipes TaxID=299642 RepID=A0A8X6UGN9_NEPPI|nr:uncharacterized protein NPIL_216411 [Nephila pilipes]GFU31026.1 uncharacterized protein NPIL_331731 [Nephila pilipes]
MPISTVYKAIKKRIRLNAIKIQIVQNLEKDDMPRRMASSMDMLRRIEYVGGFLNCKMSSGESCFHLSGGVKCTNVRLYGSETPMDTVNYKVTPRRLMCGVN